ncbi:MAG: hypothetical protein F4Y47_16700 [Acidobacteriia bacterium]|nr:hypothetical protein [Terriglobia bacterium]MYK08807.1 hypothetical protein [Terriglobia bacterium]
MGHTNSLVSFLRHYGPIPAGDNMYDELIQAEIERYEIDPPIRIPPAHFDDLLENFEGPVPRNVVLTGTAGDGKTYHCRNVWEHFGGAPDNWREGKKIVSLQLPVSQRVLTIVKDLSELTLEEKDVVLAGLARAVAGSDGNAVYLVAANDGQLLSSWRDWAEQQGCDARRIYGIVEDMLIEERTRDEALHLDLYNLSRLDASEHFDRLVEQVVEHPLWSRCEGCELLRSDGTTTCPIRINRERLRGSADGSTFRQRLRDLIRLSRANRMQLPIRDLLLLCVNILLGDGSPQRILLTCRTARSRAENRAYALTNPYANVLGGNLPERQRRQYQVFTTLEAFGIGRETDNKVDNLLIYGAHRGSELYQEVVASDIYYGKQAYERALDNYLEGERRDGREFVRTLARQRQRLFFSLPARHGLDPWRLTVYQASGMFLEFVDALASGRVLPEIAEQLVLGLNRTFCGMMIDDGTVLYLTSSGGDGRGRISSLLNHKLPTRTHRRDPYLRFVLAPDFRGPSLEVVDPIGGGDEVLGSLILQLTHFEYLVRVAGGSLPASFSRQCYEDFLDFKLRMIKRLNAAVMAEQAAGSVAVLHALTVDGKGRLQSEPIRIGVGR